MPRRASGSSGCRGARAAGALLGAFAVVGGALAAAVPALATETAEIRDAAEAASMARRINRERCARGLTPLALDPRLAEAARRHSEWLAAEGRTRHLGAGGSSLGERVTATGYRWTTVAENVAAGTADVETTFAGWWASASHRANLLRPELREAGLGHAETGQGHLRHFWTLVLAARRGARDAACPPAEERLSEVRETPGPHAHRSGHGSVTALRMKDPAAAGRVARRRDR